LQLDGVVASVCSEFARAAAAKGIGLHPDLEPVRVLGDALAVGRIVRNLLDNALKYTERGSVGVEVGVDGSADEPAAFLSVADTGKGIPTEELGRIFEEFYQLDNPARDRSKGVGLGLAIVQRLCELSGARISVSSEVGRGTTFRVRLPLATAEPEARAADQPPADRSSLRGVRVYVVDDEPDINRSMQHLLAAWGARPATADSRSSAERLFDEQGAPDLLITDLRLGEGESGAAFAVRMRQRHGHFPVLVITGETASAALEAAQRQGFTLAFKPITAERLSEAMQALLGFDADGGP
jgi:two-component system, sensor histidine kinase